MQINRQIALGFLLLIILGAVSVWLFIGAAGIFANANPTAQAAIIAGLVALVTLLFTFLKERSRAFREVHREKKIEIYSQFYDLLFAFMENAKSDNPAGEDDALVQQSFMKIARGIMFYGSPKVVTSFANFKSSSGTDEFDLRVSMVNIGKILLAMREDIGLSNRGLDEITIHQIYIRDDVRKMGIHQ